MQFDLFTSRQHYRDHALPVWQTLPELQRSTDWGTQLPGRSDNLLIVASYADLKAASHRQCVYVEHGAGQSYLGLPAAVAPFYSPSSLTRQHRNVVMFLCPNNEVRDRWARSYGDIAVTVGCPKLDPWHSGLRGKPEPRTVAITFHWEPPASVWAEVPELRSAFDIYFPVIQQTVERFKRDGWQVIGHAHPRLPQLFDFWRQPEIKGTGIEMVESSEEVLSRASVLIADNTSLQAEFMSLGRGVVWLNHPAYRRDVEHGGRFWQWPERAGVQLDTPSDLIRLDLDSVPNASWHPYAYADGHATERAVEALLSLS